MTEESANEEGSNEEGSNESTQNKPALSWKSRPIRALGGLAVVVSAAFGGAQISDSCASLTVSVEEAEEGSEEAEEEGSEEAEEGSEEAEEGSGEAEEGSGEPTAND